MLSLHSHHNFFHFFKRKSTFEKWWEHFCFVSNITYDMINHHKYAEIWLVRCCTINDVHNDLTYKSIQDLFHLDFLLMWSFCSYLPFWSLIREGLIRIWLYTMPFPIQIWWWKHLKDWYIILTAIEKLKVGNLKLKCNAQGHIQIQYIRSFVRLLHSFTRIYRVESMEMEKRNTYLNYSVR